MNKFDAIIKKSTSNSSKKQFDPDLSPSNIHNIEAAKDHNLHFDGHNFYRDVDGCPVRDKFGQTLG